MITDSLLTLFQGLPPELTVALLAALPVTELRAALPVAIGVFKMAPWAAYFWCVLGNLLPIPLIFWLFPPFMRFVEKRVPRVHIFLEHHVRTLERRHRASYDKWGALALALFIAIPFPGTGIWTATVLAIIFSIRKEMALASLAIGAAIAGLIVLALTVGIQHLI